jgi:hypothetical protein
MSHQPNQLNVFDQKKAAAPVSAAASADSDRAIEEVQAALVIAKKFPRDQVQAMDRILNACTRPTLANTALYSYPRGGTDVTGPSVRLAEAIAQQWGNIQFGIRELSAENGVSTVETFAWDVETNTRQTKVFQVKHERKARGQVYKLEDPRDIYEMVANQGARRMRACILGVIPGDVVENAVHQCEITQQSAVDVSPEKIKLMVSAFNDHYGVTQELIEKKIGKRVEAINAPQMLQLKRFYQSLKDGMAKPWDFFDMDQPQGEAVTQKSTIQVNPTKTEAKPTEGDGQAAHGGGGQANLEEML